MKRRDSPKRSATAPAKNPPAPSRRRRHPASHSGGERSAQAAVGDDASAAAATSVPVVIVGVGASAGGLEAFSELLSGLPDTPGLALLLVQHLAPQHESALPALLAARTELPVVQAVEGMRIEPNHAYIIPPNVVMGVADGALHLLPRPTDSSKYVPIDFLFRALADAAGERAIGVVLSGTGSDGAAGIREIKAVGGITIAQDPTTAKYDGMPRAAIATGMVDLVLPPKRIAAELVEIARHPYLRRSDGAVGARHASDDEPPALAEDHLQRVFTLLREATGVDFRHYKLPTIERRLQRRMALHKLVGIELYVRFLEEHPAEVHALHKDLLIHVTRFFREPESFRALRDAICPAIIERQTGDNPIRVWIAGCSTGEEAYSVAITLLECLGDRANAIPIQIFATDVSETAIEHARIGTYPESIAVDLSAERLRRFFVKVDGGYRVTKAVRDLCIFARQDLARDPPFSKLDLVVCRNVLIYMTTLLQNRLLTIFHYALKPNGYLMLGHAETVGTVSELFVVEHKRHRIYTKKHTDHALPLLSFHADRVSGVRAPKRRGESGSTGPSVQHEADRIVLERFAPPGVIVDHDLQIVQFRGQTGLFLEPAPGDPSMSLLKMAREGLLHGVRAAFHSARKGGAVRKDGLKVKQNDHWREVGVEVVPLATGGRVHFLVLFHAPPEPAAAPVPAAPAAKSAKGSVREDERIRRLEAELAASREYLQSIIQEVEATNEELQTANEEILSSNEELQSTNEELDTAKEELQSTNEELNTLNEELHGRNAELGRANSDLVNFLDSIQIAIVIVASDLRIRRFTPMAEKFLNLIASDVGRPIGHIRPNIDCPNLEELIMRAIDTAAPQEREVRDHNGNWFALRIRPYRVENRIEGAVLALFDIQKAKTQASDLHDAQHLADKTFNAVPTPLVLLDSGFRIVQGNDAFRTTFGYRLEELADVSLFELEKGAWDIPDLRRLLTAANTDGAQNHNATVAHRFPRVGARRLRMTARRVEGVDGDRAPGALLLTLIVDPAEV